MAPIRHQHPYLEPHQHGKFTSFAHRGGSGDAPENTIASFRQAVEMGYRYIETDVQLTADGVLVAFHDDDLSRTCGVNRKISNMTWSEVSKARVDDREPIPTFAELLEEFPRANINVDAKTDHTVQPLINLLMATRSLDRVCIGAFSHQRIRRIRELLGSDVCTAASPLEVIQWLAGRTPTGPSCLQVPMKQGPIAVVTKRSVARAKQSGVPVHVWTVDDPRQIQWLIDIGVDGVMTDSCSTLKSVAAANGAWL